MKRTIERIPKNYLNSNSKVDIDKLLFTKTRKNHQFVQNDFYGLFKLIKRKFLRYTARVMGMQTQRQL